MRYNALHCRTGTKHNIYIYNNCTTKHIHSQAEIVARLRNVQRTRGHVVGGVEICIVVYAYVHMFGEDMKTLFAKRDRSGAAERQ